ncbi:Asp23/Gls24 family envelope stress response protein [Pontibacter akesuensis]|uniref:hypothetical protein n=1 Tax=Pontibacter akesuensis TaxID=388950 RepID=UPI00083A963C|nr:hypothetical protein [Pontibacter akesuensis]GHA59960.1 hypothetical protein GCM10007389_10140 [Pontibacter akesuensis]
MGIFSKDTLKIGEQVQYILVHKHPAEQEVILPSDKYDFSPFELVRKAFFPTSTSGDTSTDSAVYTLRTFATYSNQQLALPVYVLHQQDTLEIFAPSRAVHLRQLVQEVKEPLQLKANLKLAPVEKRFNWPELLLWVLAILTFLSLIWLVFGQSIRRRYKLYQLKKDNVYFSSRFNAHKDRFEKTGALISIEKGVSLWKNYLTKLEDSAINSFTTKEIVEFYNNDEEINTALRICDKAIYGNLQSEFEGEANLALSMLRRVAKDRYRTHRELTKHART